MRHLAVFLKKTEHRKYLPAAFLDLYALTFRKDTGDVFIEAATSDVSYAVNILSVYHRIAFL